MKKGMVAAVCAAALLAQPAKGFGLRTHLYIGHEVLRDLEDGPPCQLSFGTSPKTGKPVVADVPVKVCEAVKKHPGHFLAGTIGPDAFPDPIIGQTYIHPGTKNGRQTADWLERLMAKAASDDEIAFAFGNMFHAAGDVFAHSYVNNYAGEVYGLFSRWHKDVELRHSLIERYIDQRLDFTPSTDPRFELKVPHRVVVRAFFQTSYVPKQLTVDEEFIFDVLRRPELTLGKLAGERVLAGAPAWHINLMRKLIAVSTRERQIGPCGEARAIADYINAYRKFVIAEHAARRHSGVLQADLPGHWESPVAQSATCIPKHDVPRGLGADGKKERKEDWFVRLQAARERAREEGVADVVRLEALRQQTYKEGQLFISQRVADRRHSWLKSLPWQLRSALRAAEAKFQDAGTRRLRAAALSKFTDRWQQDVWFAVEQYMQAGLGAALATIDANRPYPPQAYARQGATTPYRRWFSCYRPVFGGKPKEMGQAYCQRLEELGALSPSSALRQAAIGDFFRGPLYAWLEFRADLEEFTTDILLGIAGLASPSLSGLIRLANEPRRVSHDQLDKRFRKGRNGQLTFKCFSDWLDSDLGILPQTLGQAGAREDLPCRPRPEGGPRTLDPRKFIPLKHAITLSKLALLDRRGLEQVAGEWAGELGKLTDTRGEYSVILDMVRSIDGSYQWQGYQMPYPRQRGLKADLKFDGAGYPYPDKEGSWLKERSITFNFDRENVKARKGFPFYRSRTLRRHVFAMLFPEPFEGEILRRKEFNGGDYPFKPCAEDPFRGPGFGGDGPVEVCATGVD